MLLNHIIIYVMQTAKPDTVEKVIEIVTKQLCSEKGVVQPHSKFGDLGADSLDQVLLFTRKLTNKTPGKILLITVEITEVPLNLKDYQ